MVCNMALPALNTPCGEDESAHREGGWPFAKRTSEKSAEYIAVGMRGTCGTIGYVDPVCQGVSPGCIDSAIASVSSRERTASMRSVMPLSSQRRTFPARR